MVAVQSGYLGHDVAQGPTVEINDGPLAPEVAVRRDLDPRLPAKIREKLL